MAQFYLHRRAPFSGDEIRSLVETGRHHEPHPARVAYDFSYGGGEMYDAAPLSSEQIGAAQEMGAGLRWKGAADFPGVILGRHAGGAIAPHAPLRVSGAAAKDEQS